MRSRGMPCCIYPTTVMLLDDNENFLNVLKSSIEMHSRCIAFSNEQTALQTIRSSFFVPFTKYCVIQDQEFNSNERNVRFDLKKIHKQIFNAQRFNEMTILVVDYQMPNMTGVEFCKAIKNYDIKRIMLTGEADHEIAVDAFNKGLINKFIKKQAGVEINKLISQAIMELQIEYFRDLSQPIINSLINSHEHSASCIQDENFSDFLFKLLIENNYVEYYLLENKGNFLLLSEAGEVSWLGVRDEQELQAEIVYAQELYDEEPSDEAKKILEKIKQKHAIPFFYSDDDYAKVFLEWESYLHPLRVGKCGDKTYYYSLIKGRSNYDLDVKNIKAFC